jgi:hypothetical protein
MANPKKERDCDSHGAVAEGSCVCSIKKARHLIIVKVRGKVPRFDESPP